MLVDYQRLRQLARTLINAQPAPRFYQEQMAAFQASTLTFQTNPIIVRLKTEVIPKLKTNLGHGIGHATKVTLDAGALIYLEAHDRKMPLNQVNRMMVLAQCAGLLHDIRRQHAHHAHKGAQAARRLLPAYALTPREVEQISLAIQNHEAFQPIRPMDSTLGQLLSDCLYDADKFRWGPDNFAYTLWDMLAARTVPVSQLWRHYPAGMERLKRIQTTFRTPVGRRYGPEFIDIGLAVGKQLAKEVQRLADEEAAEKRSDD